MATALVVGGTAATGVSIVAGLRERGYDVTIYHRGTHELPEVDDLEHIHGGPHHRATTAADLGTTRRNVVVAAYGRSRYRAEALAHQTRHLASVHGVPGHSTSRRVPTAAEPPYAA